MIDDGVATVGGDLMLDRSRFSPEKIAAVEIDPELMRLAAGLAAGGRRKRRGGPSVIEASIRAYGEYIGLDAQPGQDAFTADDLLVILALVSRMGALAELLEQGHYSETLSARDARGEASRMAVIEAACTATLIEKDGLPAFQLLDFLARAERAAKELEA